MKTKAIIFDLDGVITNTEEYHYKAWKQLTVKNGWIFNLELNERTKGISRRGSLDIILGINNLTDNYTEEEKEAFCAEKNENYLRYIEDLTEEDILPGIKGLIVKAKAAGLKIAVASVSKNAERVLKSLGLWDSFDYVADVNKVKNPKPNPEIFLVCAKALNVEPELCVGIEDAQAGIEAISSAGMKSVGIGVNVTTVRPDIELSSTAELLLEKIVF